MKQILNFFDNLLCQYLGLHQTEIIPHYVKKKGKNLIILNTESFKRHTQETSIFKINFGTMSVKNKQKLGIAIGKIIAKNLVISFDKASFKKDNSCAK